MKNYLYLLCFTLLSLNAFSNDIFSIAQKNKAIHKEQSSSWSAIHGDINKSHIKVAVQQMQSFKRMKLYSVSPGRKPRLITTLTIANKKWYVEENGQQKIYRPFEAPFAMTNALRYFLMSKLQFISKRALRDIGTYEKDINDKKLYRKAVSASEFEAIRQQLRKYTAMQKDDKYSDSQKHVINKEALRLIDVAKKGRRTLVDSQTGIINKLHIKGSLITIQDFKYCENEALPEDLGDEDWQDLTAFRTLPVADERLLAFDRNARWLAHQNRSNTTAILIDKESQDFIRVPFKGFKSKLLGFSHDKKNLYLMGKSLGHSNSKLWKLNLRTGKQTPLATRLLANKNCQIAALSPDKQSIAVITKPGNQLLIIQTEGNDHKIISQNCSASLLKWQEANLFYLEKENIKCYPFSAKATEKDLNKIGPFELEKFEDEWFLTKDDQRTELPWDEELFDTPKLSRDKKHILRSHYEDGYTSLLYYSLAENSEEEVLTELPGLWINPQD